jgi:hypothetical protein
MCIDAAFILTELIVLTIGFVTYKIIKKTQQ